jgi:hypothetical protein
VRRGCGRGLALFGACALLALGGAAPVLAAGARGASGAVYKGKTSQGLAFELARSGGGVDMQLDMKARCRSGPVKSVKADGVFGAGHLSGASFSGSGQSTYPAGGYMAVYKLKFAGKLAATTVSGTFSVDNALYNVTSGKKVGTCNTGAQTFKGHKA